MALSPPLSLGPLCPSEDADPAWEALPVFDLGVCLLVAPLAGQEDFKPRVGSHTGTGYKSNFRPVVSCQASLEALDNPARGYGLYGSFSTLPCSSDQLQAPWMGTLSFAWPRLGVLGDIGHGRPLSHL